MTITQTFEDIACRIRDADASGELIAPIRDEIHDLDVEAAYQIQQINTKHHVENGRQICGRKIGLTSPAVQKQIGVSEPDYGILYRDMEFADGEIVPWKRLHQPKIEAEIAMVLASDLPGHELTQADLDHAIDYVVTALEIPGSRIANWDINICDTVADNASSGVYVLGNDKKRIVDVDFRLCGMVIYQDKEPVSTGCGAACMGNPLIAATWLANKMAEYNMPLKAGDVILSGALGPMVNVQPGTSYEAHINGVGCLSTNISAE